MNSHRGRSFRADGRGVSAVEFALILPLLVMFYLGVVELTEGITVDRKVIVVTGSITDLVARANRIDCREMDNIFAATAAIVSPYDSEKLKMIVTSVRITDKGQKVAWSKALHTDPHATGAAFEKDVGNAAVGSTVIVSESSYSYTPLFGNTITGPIELGETLFAHPRNGGEVEFVSC